MLSPLLQKLLLIAFASGVGGVLRYGVMTIGQRLTEGAFPIGTLLVNVTGCLCIGLLNAAFAGPILIADQHRAALTIGLLGGFTTFSAFGWETFSLANDGQGLSAMLNLLSTVTLGFMAVWFGYRLGQRLFGV